MKRWLGLGILVLLASCGRERTVTSSEQNGKVLPQTVTITVPVAAEWLATGIRMRPDLRVRLTIPAEEKPIGNPEVHERASVPTAGLHAALVRIGEKGIPVKVGESYWIQGSTISEGEELFVGRNLVPPDPFADQLTASEEATDTVVIHPDYEPNDYHVTLQAETTNSPALLTPIDHFYDNNPNPTFNWDQQDNATQYSLDISDFKDFRRILFNVTINSTSLNTAALGIDPTNPGSVTNQGPNLTEGVYYWRVRAQINEGQLLSPELTWTDRSLIFRMGIEQQQTLPSPTILTPAGSVSLEAGQFLAIEFSAQPDASGLTWRYRTFHKPCGNTINPDVDVAAEESVWQAFPAEYVSNDISKVPQLYGFFRTGALDEGQWLIRIETRDGADRTASRLGSTNYRLTAACN